jgi:hypothetical protein
MNGTKMEENIIEQESEKKSYKQICRWSATK